MRTIDLNSDLGELENDSLDAAVMPYISSCNIACGGHAGNPDVMRRTVRLAIEHGVAIGAHPGYPDHKNFGRISLEINLADLCNSIHSQILILKNIAESEGAVLRHVKLHGALYNDLADDYERSLIVCKAMASIDPALRIIGFSNSAFLKAVEDSGLLAIHEVFADRAYTDDGKLASRSQPGAVLHEESACIAQVEQFISGQTALTVDSICVHGDHPSAIAFVFCLHRLFKQRNIKICPAGHLDFTCSPLGEHSLLARLPARVAKSTHRKIRSLEYVLEGMEGINEMVPCYSELMIDFNPALISFDTLQKRIEESALQTVALPPPRSIEIPVCYDGPDLCAVAQQNGLSEADVISLHAAPSYLIYMLGFSPGFAYLGGLNSKLATPRLETPRVSVPAGAVGIADNQTGIYPVDSPGGWNLIGRTPQKLFDPSNENPFLLEPGDEVRFVPVDDGGALSPKAPRTVRRIVPTAEERTVKILDPGLYTTVQDRGRMGWQRYGLPPCGVMDVSSFRIVNALVGNPSDAAVLEATGSLPVMVFSHAARVACVATDYYQVLDVEAGKAVRFQPLESCYRAYIAIAGGIGVPVVMGSRSTYVPGKIGGFEGRILRVGDVLPIGIMAGGTPAIQPIVPQVSSLPGREVRVIPGPEADWFDCGGLNTFLSETFAVSAKSDRTGLRLEGAVLSFRSDDQMVSAGLTFGTIQVPPSGNPIIMMADHPTTGGYPRIGTVVGDDLPRLAQLRPGDQVRFREVSLRDF